jgi:hypothetical protein
MTAERNFMTRSYLHTIRLYAIACFIVAVFGPLAAVGTVKIEGIIVGRSGDEVIVPFGWGAELAFQLTDNTQVPQVGGLFNARRKQLAMAALIPGLKVKAEGVYNEQRQVLATKINFKGDDLEDAQKIQVGTKPRRKLSRTRGAGAAERGAASANESVGKAAGALN